MHLQVWVPDATRKMTQATACFFNDAAWLNAVDLRMVHPDIDNSTAEVLGCKSLRIQHLARFRLLHFPCIVSAFPTPHNHDLQACLRYKHASSYRVRLTIPGAQAYVCPTAPTLTASNRSGRL